MKLQIFSLSSEVCQNEKIISVYHGVMILNRSNNSQISIGTSAPQQAGGFIIKYYFGISNITARR